MAQQLKTNNPLNPVASDLSDDEDLFVSTYEKPAQSAILEQNQNENEQNQDLSTNSTQTPMPPPRKQSQNSSTLPDTDLVGNLESEMNTIDLNDDHIEEDGQHRAAPDAAEWSENKSSEEAANPGNNCDSHSDTCKPVMKTNDAEHQNPSGQLSEIKEPSSSETDIPTDSGNNYAFNAESSTTVTEQPKPTIHTASQISITVSDPQKIGEGMGSYMVYNVSTRTTLPYFRQQSMSVNRRFSDFLGLHNKLLMKHGPFGRIVPPPPAKSAFGTAKVKMAKDDSLQSMDFLAKRRAALERYLQRNAEHPVLCSDPDFREFLELDTELPRSTSTSALSGAGVKRLFSLVGDTVNKMTFRMEESDPWFESKQQQIDVLDLQLRKLHASVDSLMTHRKELTSSLGSLSKCTALIGHDETNVSLSCALSHLAATHEKVEKIYDTQANHDFLYLSELLRDYIAMIGAVKEAFHERVKCFQNYTSLEQALNRKRESKAKMELSMKNERLPQIDEEITELQDKVEKAKEDFEKISQTIKQEFQRFDLNRIKDFKNNFLRYMKSLLETQEALIETWETFLPEAKSISA